MDELVRWLRAVLATEADEAQAAADEFGAEWTVDEAMDTVRSDTGADVVEEPHTPRAFIARHDPARVLREIDAKRQRIAIHAGPHECASYDEVSKEINPCQWVHEGEACTTLRLESVPYVDRPGYREEWRP